jgi:hypothetical protein
MQFKIASFTAKSDTGENIRKTQVLDQATGNPLGQLVSLSMVGPAPDSFECVIDVPTLPATSSAGAGSTSTPITDTSANSPQIAAKK